MARTMHSMASMKTIQSLKAHVQAMGLTFRYQREYDEFRIDYKQNDSRWTEDSAYFTTYRDDVIDTAIAMAKFSR